MSKVTVALGSFIVGACCTFLMLSGNQTSTFAHASLLQSAMGFPGEPVVPPLSSLVVGSKFSEAAQQLDGMRCQGCEFTNVALTYAGGSYSLEGCRFSGTTRFVFKGAAANALAILPLMEALTRKAPPTIPLPNKPILRNVTMEQPMSISFDSPYGR